MKELAAIGSILWRATLLFPVAVALFVVVVTYLLLPFGLILYSLFVSPWYGLALPVLIISIYFLRRPLRTYFKDVGESCL
jgi:hypothetical protein